MERDPRFRQLLWISLGAMGLALLCSGTVVAAIYWWLQRELG